MNDSDENLAETSNPLAETSNPLAKTIKEWEQSLVLEKNYIVEIQENIDKAKTDYLVYRVFFGKRYGSYISDEGKKVIEKLTNELNRSKDNLTKTELHIKKLKIQLSQQQNGQNTNSDVGGRRKKSRTRKSRRRKSRRR